MSCLFKVRFAFVGTGSCSSATETGAAVPVGAAMSPVITGGCLIFTGLCRILAGEKEPEPCAGGCSGELTCEKHRRAPRLAAQLCCELQISCLTHADTRADVRRWAGKGWQKGHR